ncbi:MAG: alpha-L-fucosidase [Promethearchaeia archaeon]
MGTIDWSEYFSFDLENNKKVQEFRNQFGARKVYGMGLMPVRGSKGFRKLDYEFAEEELDPIEIIEKLQECHFNVFGLVIKDTDGACMWDTQVGWNPTGRDILGEFCDAAQERNIHIMASFTSMNDAYQGYLHPERVSVHGKSGKADGKKYEVGDIATHNEGEMRVDLPEGVSFEQYKKKVPFLTRQVDEEKGKARSARGKGYIPLTSFLCPNSEHIDYLLNLAEEVVKNYPIKAFFADYIRYHHSFTDLCTCERCVSKFRETYGSSPKLLKSDEWRDFREDTIVTYGKKLQRTIKSADRNCVTGWFCLPGPRKWFSRRRIGQNWGKLSSVFDVASPMEYPYLMGTRDDGWFWGKLADIFFWYFKRNMKKRAHEFNSPVLTITNSVECNKEEMLKQMRAFDFGLGIAVFKYFGTKKSQWQALKRYAEDELGLENLGLT